MARNKHPEETMNQILKVSAELFLEKGYEHTTIQDIISRLGGLSKGAIYHHFKSKEDIIEAVCDKFYSISNDEINSLINKKEFTGLQKLYKAIRISLDNPMQEVLLNASPDLMKNPRFLTRQLYESIDEIAPQVIEPFIRQGMEDGSIPAGQPRETAQFILLIANIWLNPAIFHMTEDEMQGRFLFVKHLLELIGIHGLLDNEILESMKKYRSLIVSGSKKQQK